MFVIHWIGPLLHAECREGLQGTKNGSGAEQYVSLRSEWNRYITLLAPQFALDLEEVDTAMAKIDEMNSHRASDGISDQSRQRGSPANNCLDTQDSCCTLC